MQVVANQGIDGAGRRSSAQFRRLSRFFDCWTMDVSPEDRRALASQAVKACRGGGLQDQLNQLEDFLDPYKQVRPVGRSVVVVGSGLCWWWRSLWVLFWPCTWHWIGLT